MRSRMLTPVCRYDIIFSPKFISLVQCNTVRLCKHPSAGVNKTKFVFDLYADAKVVSGPEFDNDHESGLRSDRKPVVLCDFSKLRFWKPLYKCAWNDLRNTKKLDVSR